MSVDLTVVVAAWNDTAGLRRCLAGLRPQATNGVEILVVSNVAIPHDIRNVNPDVAFTETDNRRLIPELWSSGMARASGQLVAITTAHFLPAPDWVARIRDLHGTHDGAAGVGGPIGAPRGLGPVNWATYFLRYSNYFHLNAEGDVHDIPGDNAAYKRLDLERHHDAIADGFWEPDFHRLVLDERRTLRFSPDMLVTQHACFGFRSFCGQRLRHGRAYGASRVRGKGVGVRLLRAASGILVPFVLLGKVLLRVVKSRRDFGAFLLCLPVLVAFVLAWTAGEVSGYLSFRKGGSPADEHP